MDTAVVLRFPRQTPVTTSNDTGEPREGRHGYLRRGARCGVVTSIHQLDDGAWISVNDVREVNVSDLWWLARAGFCDCEMSDFLAEGFVEVGVHPPNVTARVAGQCIACGESGVTDWLAVGRVDPDTGTFRGVDTGSVHVPRRRSRLAGPPEE